MGAAGQEARALGAGAAGNDDLMIRSQRESSFVEERDIRHEDGGGRGGLLSRSAGLAHHRVEHGFQETAFLRVLEHQRTEAITIETSVGG